MIWEALEEDSHRESPNWTQGTKLQMHFPPCILLSPSQPTTVRPHHAVGALSMSQSHTSVPSPPPPCPHAVPSPGHGSYLLLALLLQVELDLE